MPQFQDGIPTVADQSSSIITSKSDLWKRCDHLLPLVTNATKGDNNTAKEAACCVSDDDDIRYLFVPGRIEICGKHVDYLGGQSLVCATTLGMCVKIIRRRDCKFVIRSDSYANDVFEFEIGCSSREAAAPPPWAHYPKTVLTRLCKLFGSDCVGFDMAIASDLPQASGMSSSSGLVIATFLGFYFANNLSSNNLFESQITSREELCQFLGCLENGAAFKSLADGHGVGTHGGSQDHVEEKFHDFQRQIQ